MAKAIRAELKADVGLAVTGTTGAAGTTRQNPGSLYIAADTPYTYRTGPQGARLLNIRSRADHSFRPAKV